MILNTRAQLGAACDTGVIMVHFMSPKSVVGLSLRSLFRDSLAGPQPAQTFIG